MSIDWHELAKEKPPQNGIYLVDHCHPKAWAFERYDIKVWQGEYFRYEKAGTKITHWAYLTPPGEFSLDDRRLLGLLDDVADWMAHEFSTGTRELKRGQNILHRVETELEIRFGLNWEKLRHERSMD